MWPVVMGWNPDVFFQASDPWRRYASTRTRMSPDRASDSDRITVSTRSDKGRRKQKGLATEGDRDQRSAELGPRGAIRRLAGAKEGSSLVQQPLAVLLRIRLHEAHVQIRQMVFGRETSTSPVAASLSSASSGQSSAEDLDREV
jgi:hypothetical protein